MCSLGEVVLHLPGDAGVRAQECPPDGQFTGGEGRAHTIMVGPWANSSPCVRWNRGHARTGHRRARLGPGPRDPPPDHRAGHGQGRPDRPDGTVTVGVYLTVAGCPLRDTITRDVTAAVVAAGRRDGGPGRPGRDEPGAAQGAAGAAARAGPGRERDPVRQARLADQGVRGGLRQGRRRQVLADGQPRGRAGRPGPDGRRASTPTSTGTACRGCSGSPAGRPRSSR